MSDEGSSEREQAGAPRACPACGAATTAADRFCAQCGATLPAAETGAASPTGAPRPSSTAALKDGAEAREGNLWVLAARPAAVIGGGALLLLLAVALLVIGQLDDTGTIVMLSFCVAPLALLVTAIGVARAVGRRTDVGGRTSEVGSGRSRNG